MYYKFCTKCMKRYEPSGDGATRLGPAPRRGNRAGSGASGPGDTGVVMQCCIVWSTEVLVLDVRMSVFRARSLVTIQFKSRNSVQSVPIWSIQCNQFKSVPFNSVWFEPFDSTSLLQYNSNSHQEAQHRQPLRCCSVFGWLRLLFFSAHRVYRSACFGGALVLACFSVHAVERTN